MPGGLTPSAIVANTIVEALEQRGVKHVAFCPGSRNAPFAYALSQSRIETHIFADERMGAFWALGVTRSGQASAVFTTSGTAAAELHPALEEAKHRGLPLIAITSDRPYELYGVGANQTTDQAGLYGTSVDLTAIIPADDPTPARQIAIAGKVDQCITHPGPSHINVSFREPLTPGSPTPEEKGSRSLRTPPKHYRAKEIFPQWDEVVDAELNTVIVAGDGADAALLVANVAVLAEPSANAPRPVSHVPLVLPAFASEIQQVIVTGKPTLTREISALLARRDIRKILVGNQTGDASSTGAVTVPGLRAIPSGNTPTAWNDAGAIIEDLLKKEIDTSFNLLSAARVIWRHNTNLLWIGPSNAIRAFDLAAHGTQNRVYSPRGLAGIDGNISQALGLSTALNEPIRVVIGDLTFNYDLNALAANTTTNAQIIVFDDGGASIFATLEYGDSQYSHLYEKFFAAKQNLNIAQAAVACGWRSRTVTSLEQLQNCLVAPIEGREVVVVSIDRPTEIIRNLKRESHLALGF